MMMFRKGVGVEVRSWFLILDAKLVIEAANFNEVVTIFKIVAADAPTGTRKEYSFRCLKGFLEASRFLVPLSDWNTILDELFTGRSHLVGEQFKLVH